MRIILFTGKGGVGKTTTAAATAVAAARSGLHTLVMSTDAAHSLEDTLQVGLSGPDAVRVEEDLDALQVSARGSVENSWRTVQDYLLGFLDSVGVDPVVAEELTSLPGADELAVLTALRYHALAEKYDLIVVDCAPTAETLRLLALPEALAWHLERLMPAQRRLIGALRPAAAAAAGLPLPDGRVVDVVREWHEQMREVQNLLTGPTASVRIVLTPERVVIAEARRTLTSLSLYGYAVDVVIVNRILPEATNASRGRPDPWLAAWNAAQRGGMELVRESFSGIPIVTTPFLPGEPLGVDALAGLAAAQNVAELGGRPITHPPRSRGVQVSSTDDGYLLELPLRLATSADVGLQRREDDLLIDVAGHHRVVTLPSVLRRCIVKNASVRDGWLRVRFTPDQEVWPRGR